MGGWSEIYIHQAHLPSKMFAFLRLVLYTKIRFHSYSLGIIWEYLAVITKSPLVHIREAFVCVSAFPTKGLTPTNSSVSKYFRPPNPPQENRQSPTRPDPIRRKRHPYAMIAPRFKRFDTLQIRDDSRQFQGNIRPCESSVVQRVQHRWL